MPRPKEKAAKVLARKQREVIRDVMLSAGQCATWLTLDELSQLTHYPPASISAQLRHLRKPQFGGFAVEKRCRAVNKAMCAEGLGALWEYRVREVQHTRAGRVARPPRESTNASSPGCRARRGAPPGESLSRCAAEAAGLTRRGELKTGCTN